MLLFRPPQSFHDEEVRSELGCSVLEIWFHCCCVQKGQRRRRSPRVALDVAASRTVWNVGHCGLWRNVENYLQPDRHSRVLLWFHRDHSQSFDGH